MLKEVLIIILVAGIVATLPRWPYSASWGGGPASVLTILLFILLFMMAIGIA